MVISPKRQPEVKNDSLTRIVSFASGNSIDWKFVSGQVSEDGSCSADFEADAPKPKASSASMVRFPNMGNHTTSVPFNI